MPRLKAAELLVAARAENFAEHELERTAFNMTGFIGVGMIDGKYQARINVPGDGRGGMRKRAQKSLPGLYDTPRDAALVRASFIKTLKENNGGQICAPPTSDKPHKPRPKKQPVQPVQPQPLQSPMPTAMGMPLAMPMWNVPFAAVSPLPMQQLGYTPPRT